jgi:hypothetical protein
MLAFTMQFSKHERTPTHNHHQHPNNKPKRCGMEAGPARTPEHSPPTKRTGSKRPEDTNTRTRRPRRPFPQDPTVCPHPPQPGTCVPTPGSPKGAGRYLPDRPEDRCE